MRRLVLLPLILLAACTAEPVQNDADALDAELAEGVANGGDPMVRAALADPVMSDPMLTSRANIDAIRPPAQPYAAPIPAPDVAPAPDDTGATPAAAPAPGACPECQGYHDSLTLAALALRQPRALVGDCASGLGYGAGWANRLPADLPPHPAARVVEAAGNDLGGCRLRVARFVVARPAQSVVDWYFARTQAARYTAAHGTDGDGLHLLSGARAGGGAYRLFVEPGDRDTVTVTLIANTGR